MKNFIIQFFISLLLIPCSFSQAPAIEWQKTIGSSLSETLYSIEQTTDGGYILGGRSAFGISGDKTEEGYGGFDYWIIKLDLTGNIEWQNVIGGSADDVLITINQTSDGGYIAGGYSSSGISGVKTEINFGGPDFWIVKLDASGNIVWENTIGGNWYDYYTCLDQTEDGGYLIGGRSFSGISGDKSEASIGDFSTYDFWVLKLNSSGNIEWQNTIGGSSTDDLTSLQQTSDGGYILGGYSTSGVSGDKTEASKGAGDYWVVKLNSSGFITWQNTIGGSGEDVLISVSQTSDGGYILGGSSCSNISADKSENNITGWCEWKDYWIIKLNGSGNIVWDNTIGGTENDECVSVFQTAEGGYIIGGYSNSGTSTDKSENNFSGGEYGWDFWIVKLDYTGTIIQWENTIGSAGPWPYGDDYLNSSVQETADGGYIIGGTSYGGISGDKTAANIGSFDFWVIKLLPFCTVGEAELCNHLDDDCDGLIDEGEIIETIIISPTGSTAFCTGGSVILNATYSGSSVQWKRNGINIPGATSPSITASKTGTYTCATFSDCDTTLSAAIVVTENKNPNATISAGGPTTFCAGGSVVLTEIAVAGCTYQWYKGASPIVGATSLTYTATTSGNYKCRVTKAATGCFKNSNAIAVSVPCREGLPAGEAGNNIIENTFSLYPNPANNFITIETDFSTEKTIYLTDVLGQIVKTITTSENNITIDLQGIASGIYFIKMEDGINSVTQKFVKQ